MNEVVTITFNPAIDWTLTVPGFEAGHVNRVTGEESRAAGKGVNVAAQLASAGRRVAATGFLGRENTREFESLFARFGIVDEFVRINGSTRIGIKIVDPSKQETTDLNFAGARVDAASVITLRRRIELLSLERPFFVISGSVPPGVDVSLYGELVEQLRERGSLVALDTSGDALAAAINASPDLVKPNLHELEMLLGRSLHDEASLVRGGKELLARGVRMVAISQGERGALFFRGDEVLRGIPPSIEIGSSVGAGDAMLAGMVDALLREESLEQIARSANAFSLLALTGKGTVDSWRDRVELIHL